MSRYEFHSAFGMTEKKIKAYESGERAVSLKDEAYMQQIDKIWSAK